ncbi:MAG: PASTA domain-containing protein [Microthrixaceae bacterium]|nr:PASTA domain-containing protein [Microthrixaceae bacterium]
MGVVLYEMVTGRPPFAGDTPLAIAYKHVQDQPAAPSTIIGDLPPGVDAIIMKLLSKRPDDRYASAEELRMDLRRFLHGETTNAERVQATGTTAAATAVQPAVDGYPVEEPEEEGRSRTGWFLAAMVVLLALVAGGLFWWANGLNADVEVPDLIGETREEAERLLSDRGLVADVTEEPNDKVGAGRVSAQDPEAGTELSEGDSVKLTVSTGKATKAVPDVVTRTEAEARFILSNDGFEVRVENVEDAEAESGIVVSQDPVGGTKVAEGSPVTIRVSLGPGEEVVPDVSGQSLSSAQNELQAKGFRIGGPQEESSDSFEEGQVTRTEPAAGATVERNAVVTVFVSTGAERIEVPDVTNQAESTASAALRGEGFDVSVETKTVGPGDPVGRVLSQNPSGGTPADKGSTVVITVGVAPAPTTTTSSTSSSTTSTSAP